MAGSDRPPRFNGLLSPVCEIFGYPSGDSAPPRARGPASGAATNPRVSMTLIIRWAEKFLAILLAAAINAQQPLNTQLLVDPGFESGSLAAWPAVQGSGSSVVDFYGGTLVPFSVGQAVGGGVYFLRATSLTAVRRVQTIDLQGNAMAIDAGQLDIEIAADLGGVLADNDEASFIVRFINAFGQETSSETVGPVTPANRNFETRYVNRRLRSQIPNGTRSVEAECRLGSASSPFSAFLDNASIVLRGHQPPQPVVYGAELLQNGGFESGDWAPWIISTAGFGIDIYGGAGGPSFAHGQQVGGGTYFLDATVNAQVFASQRIDLRGNASDVDAGILEVVLDGQFGGRVGDSDTAVLKCSFLGALGQTIAVTSVGGVSLFERYNETVSLRRSGVAPVPPGCRTLAIEVGLLVTGNGANAALADNLSAVVRLRNAPSLVPYGTELLANPSFELPQTYDPASASGWRVTDPYVRLDLYGNAGMPPSSLAQAIGGGSRLGMANDDGGFAELEQRIDLSGNVQDVDSGIVSVQLGGWFGGRGSDPDQAELAVAFITALGQVMSEFVIGNVTAADRGNVTTLLFRQGSSAVPVGTRSIAVRVRLRAIGPGNSAGLVDLVSCMLSNNAMGGAAYPGTGEDLHLFTGINANPTGGFANEIKFAQGLDTLGVRMDSFSGVFDGSLLFVVADVFNTGSPVPGALPGIAIGSPISFLVYGLGPVWQVLQPAGSSYAFVIPPATPGLSIRLQGVVFSTSAANSLYASTNAHEIRLQ